MSRAATKLTYEDYLGFPEDGLRHEIIDGEHYVNPAPNLRHQRISGKVFGFLWVFLRSRPIGEVFSAPFDVVLSGQDVVQPDLLYVSKERTEIFTEKNVQGAPDLVVEILSQSTRREDEKIKLRRYELFGVREYWIVDPELELIKVYRPGDDRRYVRVAELSNDAGDALTTPLLPGFNVALAEIFAE